MKITCFIEYKVDPFQIDKFVDYAKNWGEIIPACGGELIAYFLPHEGTNNIAYGLISFASLADYERYRNKLKTDLRGRENFDFAFQNQFILEETRSFLKVVPETFLKKPTKD